MPEIHWDTWRQRWQGSSVNTILSVIIWRLSALISHRMQKCKVLKTSSMMKRILISPKLLLSLEVRWMASTVSIPILWTNKTHRHLVDSFPCQFSQNRRHQSCFRQLVKIRGLASWIRSDRGTCSRHRISQANNNLARVPAYTRRRNWNQYTSNRLLLMTMMACRLSSRMRDTEVSVPWALRTSTYLRKNIEYN